MPKLLVINYAMDDKDAVFPHQIEVVRELALSRHFQKILVITNSRSSEMNLPSCVEVFDLKWQRNKNLRNIFAFLRIFFLIFFRERNFHIFSHMTEVQSALISPLSRLFGLKHFLWYAHKSRSPFLLWNSIWVDKIFTSTRASCPIQSKKVVPIGQAIKENLFPEKTHRDFSKSEKWIHVGRIDPSKGIDKITEIFSRFKDYYPNMTLTFIGGPTAGNEDYFLEVQELAIRVGAERISFLGSLTQPEISRYLQDSDLFIHSFQGSLDKTLVEAVFSGIPIVTCNLEFHKEFTTYGVFERKTSDEEFLYWSVEEFLKASPQTRKLVAKQNREIAIKDHSLHMWISRLIYEMGL